MTSTADQPPSNPLLEAHMMAVELTQTNTSQAHHDDSPFIHPPPISTSSESPRVTFLTSDEMKAGTKPLTPSRLNGNPNARSRPQTAQGGFRAWIDPHNLAVDPEEGKIAILLSACSKNDVQRVVMLLRAGIHPSSADYDARTGLHLAASEGHIEIAKVLVDAGAAVNAKDRFGSTPLDDAVRLGFLDVSTYLRSVGGTHGTMDRFEQALLASAARGDLESATKLLKSGVNVNCQDYDRRTPLHLAVVNGHLPLVQLLLEYKANPLAEDRIGTTPLFEANRHATRSGDNPIKEAFATFQENHSIPLIGRITTLFGIWEIIMIILFGLFTIYTPKTTGKDLEAGDGYVEVGKVYAFFQDVHVMIFIGFGYLMVFLRKNAYQSLGMTFLLAAFTIQWYILCAGLWDRVLSVPVSEGWKKLELDIELIIRGDFCAGSILIAYGVVLGKVSPLQMMFVALIQAPMYALNEKIGSLLSATDLGGTMTIHMFGAVFGITLSLMLMRHHQARGHPHNAAVYHSDTFAMVGTLFLWLFWPSFNGALGKTGNSQHRAALNTILSLCGSCVSAFLASHTFRREAKFNMVDVQNATLAGGVAMGACADLMILPGPAIAIGAIAGILSVAGYVFVQPFLERRIGLHDTCGVNNLHGMPSFLGGFASIIAAYMASYDTYGETQMARSFPARPESMDGRSASTQAAYQMAFICTTVGIALVSAIIVGWIIKHEIFEPMTPKEMFQDELYWEVPEIEIPYYFDHRGEVTRDIEKGTAVIPTVVSSHQQQQYTREALDTMQRRLAILENQLSQAGITSGSGGAEFTKIESVFDKLLQRLDGGKKQD